LSRWVVLRTPEFKDWYDAHLSDRERDAIVATVLRLQVDGPAMRRPLAGTVRGSRFPNMKELIPPAGNVRILYIFDPKRRAILLLGGDKTGNWTDWYISNIPIADAIYERHLSRLAEKPGRRPDRRKRGRTQ
jgi:hypothetical protein